MTSRGAGYEASRANAAEAEETPHGLSRSFLLVGGAVYLALWVYGLVIDLDSDWNFVSLNTADNWLPSASAPG